MFSPSVSSYIIVAMVPVSIRSVQYSRKDFFLDLIGLDPHQLFVGENRLLPSSSCPSKSARGEDLRGKKPCWTIGRDEGESEPRSHSITPVIRTDMCCST